MRHRPRFLRWRRVISQHFHWSRDKSLSRHLGLAESRRCTRWFVSSYLCPSALQSVSSNLRGLLFPTVTLALSTLEKHKLFSYTQIARRRIVLSRHSIELFTSTEWPFLGRKVVETQSTASNPASEWWAKATETLKNLSAFFHDRRALLNSSGRAAIEDS